MKNIHVVLTGHLICNMCVYLPKQSARFVFSQYKDNLKHIRNCNIVGLTAQLGE